MKYQMRLNTIFCVVYFCGRLITIVNLIKVANQNQATTGTKQTLLFTCT
jgi:hypothetical protein